MSSTSNAPLERYSRQIRFAPIGEEGQRRIGAARVAVVGCGALGSLQAEGLARAGVGYLRIIDRDYIELSNLQRQWLFDEADAAEGLPKAAAAARHLRAINSSVSLDGVVADLAPSNAEELLGDVDLILDGTDNFGTRYLINDFAVSAGRPWIYGAAVGSYGLKMTVVPGRTGCLKCVYPEPPSGLQPTCETAGVLGAITAAVAALQLGDALKLLAAGPESIGGKLTMIDVWNDTIRQIGPAAPRPDCPACGRREFVHLNGGDWAPISLCGRNAVQIHERSRPIDLHQLAGKLEPLGAVRSNEFALRFTLPPYELTVFPDGRAIVKGTTDAGVARSLYARYVGA